MGWRGLMWRALAFASAVLLIASALGLRSACGDEEVARSGLDEAEITRLKGKVRSRAAAWWRYRKPMATICPQCKGNGKVRWRQGRRRVLVDCPKCDGHKRYIDKDDYRHCYYDLRSPAFRLQEGVQARVTEAFIAAREGNPAPVIVTSYSIQDIEIVDTEHAIVHVEQNGDSVARPQRWVLAEEGRKPATWFFYDPAADGPWPGEGGPAVTGPADAPPVPEPAPEPPAPAPEVAPEAVRPVPPPVPSGPEPERATLEDSLPLVRAWTEERNDCAARVIRIEMGLDEVEGHEEKVATARRFVKEIKAWLDEEKDAYERAVRDVEEQSLGVRLDDRLKINTMHFKAHRRLELVERMLIAVVPELND